MVKACPICKSRKWRKDAVTGNAVCDEGHVFQDFRSENLVVDNANFTLQRRAKRTGPKKNQRREEGRANKEYLHGPEAEWLKLQALQLLLRYQTQAIQKIYQLPDAYEIIVRDLWAYQLAISPLPPKPGREGTASPEASTQSGQPNDSKDAKQATLPAQTDTPSSSGSDTEVDDESHSDSENLEGVDPALLAEISEEEDNVEDEEQEMEQLKKERERFQNRKRNRKLNVGDTIVTIALGLWTMRIPFMMVDLEDLINSNQVPYLDFAYTTFVPENMRARMNRKIRNALSPIRSPKPTYLFELMRHFARGLVIHYGINFPEVNLHPLSWRIVSQLGGQPSTYRQIHNLLSLIDTNLSLWTDVERVYRRQRYGKRSETDTREDETQVEALSQFATTRPIRYKDVIMPELSIVAAWLCVMKMIYGLDGEERDSDDPVLIQAQEKGYLEAMAEVSAEESLYRRNALLKELNVANMDQRSIDLYLNHAQQVLLSHHQTDSETPFFLPPYSSVDKPNGPNWNPFHFTAPKMQLLPVTTAHQDHTPGVGERYVSWDSCDYTGELPKAYETMLLAASELIGVSKWDVADVVELFDRRLLKVRRRRSFSSKSRSRSRSRDVSETVGEDMDGRGLPYSTSSGLSSVMRSRSSSRDAGGQTRSERVDAIRARLQRAASAGRGRSGA